VTTLLFVYGTLRSDFPRTHRLLGDARLVGRGTIAGTLYDLGRYPAVALAGAADARVVGEVHVLVDGDARLAALDRYEGGEYLRAELPVDLDDGRVVRAWAYVLAGPPPAGARIVPSGIYRRRDDDA
jgi:gamma-glutamylcyclotransferase (GGCT)/AIG2-like uncharacterized protein YtfP